MRASTALRIVIGLGLIVLLGFLAYDWLGLGSSVRGSINYELEEPLPSGSRLIIELRDTSYQDASSKLIVRQIIADPPPPPHSFKLGYGSVEVDTSSTYSIQAKIEDANRRLLFINETAYDVITGGHSKKVDLELVSVR